MPKPPYFQQTYPFSCVPACLKMVLASLGCDIFEAELRALCECDETGTSPSKAVEAAIQCGFDAYQANLTIEELTEILAENLTPIIFIRFSVAVNYSHAIVIYKITSKHIYALDPSELEERKIKIDKFLEIWSRGLTIVIEKTV